MEDAYQKTNKESKADLTSLLLNKLIKIVLFWSIFLFAVCLETAIFSSPKGGFGVLVRGLIVFTFTVIITGIMLKYGSAKVLKIGIVITWVITILLAIS